MTIEQLEALPVGTRVDWNRWGLIDGGVVVQYSAGRGIRWDDATMFRPNGLDLVEVLYGPFDRQWHQPTPSCAGVADKACKLPVYPEVAK